MDNTVFPYLYENFIHFNPESFDIELFNDHLYLTFHILLNYIMINDISHF